jgi:hypothetical protein
VSQIACHYGQIRTLDNLAVPDPKTNKLGDHEMENVIALLNFAPEAVHVAPDNCTSRLDALSTSLMVGATGASVETVMAATSTVQQLSFDGPTDAPDTTKMTDLLKSFVNTVGEHDRTFGSFTDYLDPRD